MSHHLTIQLPAAELKNALLGLGKVLNKHTTLPVLGCARVTRDRQGWVSLLVTDLDTFATLRLEAPGSMGSPTEFLVPFADLQKVSKSCPPDAVLELERVADEQVLTRYHLGQHPVEQTIAVPPVADFPTVPEINAPPISLDEATRDTLLDALACASDDETRPILNGAYLDVSKPNGHYAVATDGRHLYSSNSLHLALPSSVLIPGHRFLLWGGFAKDGQWRLAVQPATKEKGGCLLLESRRWRFVSKQVEGTYPNWRSIAEEVRDFSGTLVLSEQAAEAIQAIVPRLPGDEEPNHTVGLHARQGRLFLRGWNKGQEVPTEVEVPGVTVQGTPETVYLNRKYLLRAVGFGLLRIEVQEAMKPLRFSDGASRRLIVMPVRVDGYTNAPAGLRHPAPFTPAAASQDLKPDQPATSNPTSTTERNQPAMQNTTTTQYSGQATAPAVEPAAEKVSVEQALDQLEFVKTSLRGVITNLNGLADTLRQVQRERRVSEREVRSVRDTLKSLQTVRL